MFEFATAGRILFGRGTLKELAPAAATFGKRAMVVTGKSIERAGPVLELLKKAGVEATTFSFSGEPRISAIQESVGQAREFGTEFVIGIGGGSALDAAKAIAALLTNPGDIFNYLEVIGRAQPLKRTPLPCVAIPTTAGTGAEVTRNAVLLSPEHRVKVSLRHPTLLPRLAIVDPALTDSLPPDVTASTGLDALTQLIEPYVSARANPLTDSVCIEGMKHARALRRAYANDQAARDDMSVASLFGGMALANAGLGAVHGFAAPIGGMFDAPHGAVCAALLPHAMEINVRALRQRGPAEIAQRFEDVSRILTDNPQARAEDGIAWVTELCRDLQIPGLRTYGITEAHAHELCDKASVSSSMKANPVTLTKEELQELVVKAL
jgi:alcohol dehydrogenase class IV